MKTLTFYFDYISPYAYLGWTQIHVLADKHGLEIEPVPVLFAGLLQHHGHKGPAEIPVKREYIYKDCVRIANLLEVPLGPPASHPFNPLLALRVTCLAMESSARRQLIDSLFKAVWARALDVTDPAVVAALCEEVGVKNAPERASTQAIKDQVRSNTDEAIGRGAFGVPTMWLEGELFWGVDSLRHLDRFLAGKDPLTADAVARWHSVPISAERR